MLSMPQHVALIMDGNGRWGVRQGHSRAYGHKQGIKAVRQVVQKALELKIPHLSFFAFAQANWQRPKAEVDFLMQLFAHFAHREAATLQKEKIQVRFVGDLKQLPAYCRASLQRLAAQIPPKPRLQVVVGVNYSGRWDLAQAARTMAEDVKKGTLRVQDVDELCINTYLSTAGVPDPDLLIRTGGDLRLSNFFLWQLANTEIYVTDTLWPAFTKVHFTQALAAYRKRERRMGKTSAQINSTVCEKV